MLIGAFYHNLQSKRRLAIPSNFREELGEKVILTKGLENCLQMLPFNIWEEMIKNLGTNPLSGADSRNLRRILAHDAYEVEYDAQGRIIIPQSLVDWAQLEKQVVIAGSIDWIELWNDEAYKSHMNDVRLKSVEIGEKIGEVNRLIG